MCLKVVDTRRSGASGQSAILRVSLHRAFLQRGVRLFPILFARQKETVLARDRIEAPSPGSAFMDLAAANAFQSRDLLPKLRVLFFQPCYFHFSSLELLKFLRLDDIVAAAANQAEQHTAN